MKKQTLLAAVLFQCAASQAFASCGAASCSVNTSWDVQGAFAEPGARLDLRYEYIRQDQLRTGTDKTSVGAGDATETRTVNRNLVATLDYDINPDWGVALTLPWVSRDHAHIPFSDPATVESWNFSGLGDARIVGRYLLPVDASKGRLYGVKFGAKLPTGKTDVANADGTPAERALQPGTGSTDLLLGAYLYQALPGSAGGWFMQALWQRPVETFNAYRPGDQISADAGLRYLFSDKLSGLLQLNLLHKDRDTGAHAEPALSGGNYANLSPGLSYAVARDVQMYGFLQKPIYQNVRGTQLTADWSAVAGMSLRF